MLPLRQSSYVCRLAEASVPYTASSASMDSALDNPLQDPADRNWLELPGSVLVPVTGGGTKQPCMFHHQVRWFGSMFCSRLALCVETRRMLQRLALSRWGEVLQLACGASYAPMHACSISLAVLPWPATLPTPCKSWPVLSPVRASVLVWPGGPDPHVCLAANPLSVCGSLRTWPGS